MPDEPIKINNGMSSSDATILNAITSSINSNFNNLAGKLDSLGKSTSDSAAYTKALNDSIRKLFGSISDLIESQTDVTKSNEKMHRSFNRSYPGDSVTSKDIAKTSKKLQRSLDSILDDLNKRIEQLRDVVDKGVTVETLGSKQKLDILYDYRQKIQQAYSEAQEELRVGVESTRRELLKLEKERKSLEGLESSATGNEKKKLQEQINELSKNIERLELDSQEKLSRLMDNVTRSLNEKLESAEESKSKQEEKTLKRLEELKEKLGILTTGGDVGEKSGAFAGFVSEQQLKESKSRANEEFIDAVNKRQKMLSVLIAQINRQLKENKKLTKEERENLERQRELAKQQKEYLNGLTPVTNIWRQAGQDMKKVGKDFLSGLFKDTLGLLKNRFLDSYEKGFENVYNSLESTRNQISARLGLDQGRFESLINELQADISSQGLEGVMSVVDLQEALVSLSSAGINDEELLKELTMQMARLKASGSSLDLSNEETLANVLAMIQQGATTQDIGKLFETAAAQERVIREQYGDTALVHGGFNQILNQVLDLGTAYNKGIDEISKDLGDSALAAQQLANMNVPTDVLISTLNDIAQKPVGSLSKYEQTLIGIYNELQTGQRDFASFYEEAAKQLYGWVSSTDNDFALNELINALGINMTATQAKRFSNVGGVKVGADIDFDSRVETTKEAITESLKSSEWVSRTEEVMNKAENSITDLAQTAEEFYEGDKAFLTVAHNIEDKVGQIITILGHGLENTTRNLISGGTKGLAAGTAQSTVTGGLKSAVAKVAPFLVGAEGTLSGTIGKGLGIAGGAGIAAYNIYSDIKEGKGLSTIAKDSNVAMGIGTALGSAILGPLGGVVGGALYKGASKIGNAIGDAIANSPVVSAMDYVVGSLSTTADELLNAATEQYKAATTQINTFEGFNTNQKKAYLLETGNLELEEANLLSSEDINNKFAELVLQDLENKKKEALLDAQKSQFVKENASNLATIHGDISDITKLSNESDMTYGGASERERAITARLGKESAASLVEMATLTEGDTKSLVESITMGVDLSEKEKQVYIDYIDELLARKKIYDENNTEFQKKWNDAKNATSGENIDEYKIWQTYAEMYNVDSAWPGPLKVNQYGALIETENGIPKLDDSEGMYYKNRYEGKFETGMTDIPYNNYPALLHEGERVLTKREAEVYNEMSSYALNQMSSLVSSSNAYSNNYRNSNIDSESLNNSINNQTISVETLLKRIIELIQNLTISYRTGNSGKDNNMLLRMNSNMTQVNTYN